MERLRKILSIAYGVLLGTGMAWAGGCYQAWSGPRIMVGVMLGIGAAVSLLHRPERHTRKLVVYVHVPLMAGLVIWMVSYGKDAYASWVSAIGGALFLAISFALAQVNEALARKSC